MIWPTWSIIIPSNILDLWTHSFHVLDIPSSLLTAKRHDPRSSFWAFAAILESSSLVSFSSGQVSDLSTWQTNILLWSWWANMSEYIISMNHKWMIPNEFKEFDHASSVAIEFLSQQLGNSLFKQSQANEVRVRSCRHVWTRVHHTSTLKTKRLREKAITRWCSALNRSPIRFGRKVGRVWLLIIPFARNASN